MRCWALVLLAGCAASRPATVLAPGDPTIDTACVLLADGALCTFTAHDSPGQRCVVVAFATRKGTPVLAEAPTCSGPLEREDASTRVVRFPQRPADSCGEGQSRCSVLVVPYGDDSRQAVADARASASAPPSQEECEAAIHHTYEIWRREDCRGRPPPELVACERELSDEEQREGPEEIEQCARAWDRLRLECEKAAQSDQQIARCEDDFEQRRDEESYR